jgi:hypothetical protein
MCKALLGPPILVEQAKKNKGFRKPDTTLVC